MRAKTKTQGRRNSNTGDEMGKEQEMSEVPASRTLFSRFLPKSLRISPS